MVIAWRVEHDSVNTTMNIYEHLYSKVADLLNTEAIGELESNLVDMATEMRFRKAGGWS